MANLDVPPVAQSWHIARIEAGHNARFSTLEAALQLAEVTLPEDPAKRVVVVSDGNENLGQAKSQAAKMHAAGIGIDCVPISYERQGEVTVEEIAAAAGGHQ